MNKRKTIHFGVLAFFLILFASVSVHAQILVLSPHPDDDIITSSGVTYRAVQNGETVTVVYMTNGDDYSTPCGYTLGYGREVEAVNGESNLGVPENSLIFLGYPDNGLQTIYNSYPTPVANTRLHAAYRQLTRTAVWEKRIITPTGLVPCNLQ